MSRWLFGGSAAKDEHDIEAVHDGDNWREGGFDFEEHRPRSTWRRTAGCLVPVVLVGGVGYGGFQAYKYLENFFGGESCRMVSGGTEEKWRPEQAANASTITTVAVLADKLPKRAAHIAISTAIQESKLQNLTYGDRDSLGLFQQRPSQGWGTAEEIRDPVYSSRKFYEHLVEVDEWQTRPLTVVAQEVQVSGHPDAYADHDDQGRVITDVLSGEVPAAVGCRLDKTSDSTAPAELATKLRKQTGVSSKTSTSRLDISAGTTQRAWAVAGWAVTHAQADGVRRVTVGDQEWRRERGRDGWRWHDAGDPTGSPSAVRIDLS